MSRETKLEGSKWKSWGRGMVNWESGINIDTLPYIIWASQVVQVVKNRPANAGDLKDAGLIPGLGLSPGGGHNNPLWYYCLENPMDRGAWWATVHRVAKSQT